MEKLQLTTGKFDGLRCLKWLIKISPGQKNP